MLPSVQNYSIARKLLERFEGTPLELDMRSVLAKVAESLEGTISLDVEALPEVKVLAPRELKVRVKERLAAGVKLQG